MALASRAVGYAGMGGRGGGGQRFPVCYNPYSCIQEIDPYSLEPLVLKKVLIPVVFLALSVALVNCGGSSSSGARTSGIAFRAFVSNPVGGGVNIVNAETDVRATTVGPISAGTTPSLMVVTPNRAQTLVFSPGSNLLNPENALIIIDNTKESSAGQAPLHFPTESMVVSPDSSVAYVAVPLENVAEQSQGAIELIGLTASTFGLSVGEIAIPSVQYISINNGGDRILAFSPNSDSIAVVTPSNLGTSSPVVTYVGGFDRPVQAFFSSDDTTAFVINCGAECGGNQASVQQFDMTTNTLGGSVAACAPAVPPNLPQCAGSFAVVNGSTMYLAGTPYMNNQPSQPCTGETTAAQTCGLLSIIDLSSMTVTGNAIITDGYHDRMAMGANGQLFIGARTCTEIVPTDPPPPGAEVRGCLSIYNTLATAAGNVPAGGVVIPPVNGDVTGIQPIGTRDVVYVVQGYIVPGGSLFIYCAAIDANDNCPAVDAVQIALPNNPTYAPLMVGNFYDVVTVDF